MKFITFLAVSLAFLSTFSLSLQKEPPPPPPKVLSAADSLLPLLDDDAGAPTLTAQGVVVKDEDSGVVLYEKNPDQSLLPASTTKLMTAVVALEEYPLDEVVTVASPYVDGKKMFLVDGEQITVESLLYGALVESANDAAEILAKHHPLGRDEFIRLMNEKALSLNMRDTHFENPTGLDGENHVSSAKDMVKLAEYAMQNEKIRSIASTKEVTVTSTDGKIVHNLENVNELLGKVSGVLGIKTGWTENARENLVTYVERDDHKILIALLGSQDRFGETEELIDWTFGSHSWVAVSPDGVAEGSGAGDVNSDL